MTRYQHLSHRGPNSPLSYLGVERGVTRLTALSKALGSSDTSSSRAAFRNRAYCFSRSRFWCLGFGAADLGGLLRGIDGTYSTSLARDMTCEGRIPTQAHIRA